MTCPLGFEKAGDEGDGIDVLGPYSDDETPG